MRYALFIAATLLAGAASAAGPVKIERNSKALEFSYEWPAEAAAIPALDRRFRAEMAKDYREAMANARADQKAYREEHRDGINDFFSSKWTTLGETARLLSLQGQLGSFTGGAHPNTSYDALIWDRKANRQIAVAALFRTSASFAAVTRATYCKRLDAERTKRREGEKLDLPDFNACPAFPDLAIAPVDQDRNGHFDSISFVASPYVAGPYAEGEYEISVPVTAAVTRALKPQFRSSFEPQRQ